MFKIKFLSPALVMTASPTMMSAAGQHLKITDAQISEMRALRATGQRLVDLSRRYGVSVSHLSRILSGQKRAPSTPKRHRKEIK